MLKLGKNNYIMHTLSNVLHVPSANACLLSISKFTESKGIAQFRKGQVNLLQANGKLLGVEKGEKGLYVLNTVNIPMDTAYLVAVEVSEVLSLRTLACVQCDECFVQEVNEVLQH